MTRGDSCPLAEGTHKLRGCQLYDLLLGIPRDVRFQLVPAIAKFGDELAVAHHADFGHKARCIHGVWAAKGRQRRQFAARATEAHMHTHTHNDYPATASQAVTHTSLGADSIQHRRVDAK